MASLVYLLCAMTSLVCAVLLLRSYARTRTRLLMWSGACFVGFTLANTLLFADLVLFPQTDLSLWRNISLLTSVALLLYGLVWDSL